MNKPLDCNTSSLALPDKYTVEETGKETVPHGESVIIGCSDQYSSSNDSIVAECKNGVFYDSNNITLTDMEALPECFAGKIVDLFALHDSDMAASILPDRSLT